MKTLNFTISYEQFLTSDGCLAKPLPASETDSSRMIKAYKTMVFMRAFDQKAIALQRTGQLGTYPSILGQEAIGTAIGLALHKDDVFTPYYRDLCTQFLRGVSLKETLLYWGGSERGNTYENCLHDFPICVPIATQCSHAAGAATAMKIKGVHHAALVTCGEGATSKGDFLETLNLAGTWQLPLVIVVNNNQWAISTPRSIQCGAQTIAQKAIGAGISGCVVDGNDYFAVHHAVSNALIKAYAGKGATLIEAVSYRLGDHTTADDAGRYRDEQELKQAWLNEPIRRMNKFLCSQSLWSDTQEKELVKDQTTIIGQAVEDYLNEPEEAAEAMFDHLFETLPIPLQNQYAELQALTLVKNNLATSSSRVKGGVHETS